MAENPTGEVGGVITHLGVGRYVLPVNAAALIPSADYKSADPTPVEFPTLGATGIMFFVNMSVVSGAGNTVTVNVDAWDPVSATWVPLGAGVALTSAVQAFVVTIDPRIASTTGKAMQSPVPDRVRVRPVGSGTRTTLTYSVGAALCL